MHIHKTLGYIIIKFLYFHHHKIKTYHHFWNKQFYYPRLNTHEMLSIEKIDGIQVSENLQISYESYLHRLKSFTVF